MSSKSYLFMSVIFILLTSISHASELEKYQILKISSIDQKAVIKTPEGKLQVFGVGDNLADARVVEVGEGLVVLERAEADGPETVIIRFDGNHQRIERIRKQGEKPPVMLAPPKAE